jgi:thiol-disulfide isomerase/thioredoxin
MVVLSGGRARAQGEPQPSKEMGPQQATATLKIGDAAPGLSVEKWVKGDPVTGFEKGKIYVVEFWATTCGPCVASIPRLSALQSAYKDKGVTIIGVTGNDPNNTLAKVEKMVTNRGEGMGYTVAWDKGEETQDRYIKAAGLYGIPWAFVVDQNGKVAYIGHPMVLDVVLDGVIAGTWDNETGTKEIQKLMKVLPRLNTWKDPKAALATFGNLESQHPTFMADMQGVKLDLLLKAGETEEASRVGHAMMAKAVKAKDAYTLCMIARSITIPKANGQTKDLGLAMDAATKALEFAVAEEERAPILDTLARVHFVKGDVAKAIEVQEQAVAAADEDMKKELQEALDEYRAAQK